MELKVLEKIAANTEKIARNTDHDSSFYISISERSTKIRTKFNLSIELDKNKKYGMALVSLETFYSFPNIDASNNNFRYSPDDGKTWSQIEIPVGSYELVDINGYIQRIMKQNRQYNSANESYYITLEPNNNTLKAVLNITEPRYRVDFTAANSMRTVLGFNRKVYAAGYHES